VDGFSPSKKAARQGWLLLCFQIDALAPTFFYIKGSAKPWF
jgi:hypothetical protein